MRRDDSCLLLDMLIAARDAVSFAENQTYSGFVKDRRTHPAIFKSVEIVGEAASRVSTEFQEAHPAVPWRKITGLRNRLVHGYFDVNMSTVWDTVRNDLPALIGQLEALVPPEAE